MMCIRIYACYWIDVGWWDGPTSRSDVRHRISLLTLLLFFAAIVCKAVSLDFFPLFPTNYVGFLSIEFFAADICKAASLQSMPPKEEEEEEYVFECSLEQHSEFLSPGEKCEFSHRLGVKEIRKLLSANDYGIASLGNLVW